MSKQEENIGIDLTPANDEAYFCPTCGGAAVDFSALTEEAHCKICSWKGSRAELAVFRFSHTLGDQAQTCEQLFMDMRQLLGKHFSAPFAAFLGKWGFLDIPTTKSAQEKARKHLARYIGHCAGAFIRSIIEVRHQIEKEEHSLGN